MDRNPYVGPRAFDIDESDYFFGREEETEILQGLVMSRRVVLLFAKSGVGKSSLVRAGLIPRLTAERKVGRGNRARQLPPKMKALPIATVGGALPTQIAPNNVYSFIALYSMRPDADPNDLVGQTLAEGLAELIDYDGHTPQDSIPLLLIFDQFEELFTRHLTRWEDREAFFRQVSQALHAHPTLHILFVMREDYIAELTPYTNLIPGRLETDYRLERLDKEAALKAVRQPAKEAKRPFAENIAEELVDNLRRIQIKQQSTMPQAVETNPLGEYVEPVHLQIVCRQLWASLPIERTRIEASDVQAFGDVDEALTKFYESTLHEVLLAGTIAVSERRLRNWFDDPLITPARTRGLVYRGEDETAGLPNSAVDILNEAYIIRADKRGGDIWYELAHDRLIEPILATNQKWQERYQNPITQAAEAWRAGGEDPERLYRGDQLKQAQHQLASASDDFTELEKEFIRESQKVADRKQVRRQRWMIFGALVFAVVVIIFAFWALQQRNHADDARALAEQRQREADTARAEADAFGLATASRRNLESNPSLSLLLAIEAVTSTYQTRQSVIVDAEDMLHQAIWQSEQTNSDDQEMRAYIETVQRTLSGHDSSVISLAFSPDSHYLATADEAGDIKVWEVATGELLSSLVGHQATVLDITFNPNATPTQLLTASLDGTVKMWDLSSGQLIRSLSVYTGGVKSIELSRQGTSLVTIDVGGSAIVWDTNSGRKLFQLSDNDEPGGDGQKAKITDADYSPDNSLLVTADETGVISCWNAHSGQKIQSWVAHTDSIRRVTFSRDGNQLVTASTDETAKVWDMASDIARGSITATIDHRSSMLELYTTTGHRDPVIDAVLVPNSSRLLTIDAGGTAKMWDVIAQTELSTLFSDVGTVNSHSLQLNSSPQRLALAHSGQNTVQVWGVNTAGKSLNFNDHLAKVTEVVFSPDGKWLATASNDSLIRFAAFRN